MPQESTPPTLSAQNSFLLYSAFIGGMIVFGISAAVIAHFVTNDSEQPSNPTMTTHADAPTSDPAPAVIMSMVPLSPPPTKAVVTGVDLLEEPIPLDTLPSSEEVALPTDCIQVNLADEKYQRICADMTPPLADVECVLYLVEAWKRSDITVSTDFSSELKPCWPAD